MSSVDLAVVSRIESLAIASFFETDSSPTASILTTGAIVLKNLWTSAGKRRRSNCWYVVRVLIDGVEGISLGSSTDLCVF